MNSEFLTESLSIVNKWYNSNSNQDKLYIIDTLFSYCIENIDILKTDENLYSDFKEKAEYFFEIFESFKDEQMSCLEMGLYNYSLKTLIRFLEI
jgi:hypothetical protein